MSKVKYAFLSLSVVILCVGLGLLALPVYAGENFGTHYPGGNEDFMAGALPPAGTNIFINYLLDYNINQLNGNSGSKATFIRGGAPNFTTSVNAQALVNAFRLVRVTKIKLLGGDLVLHGILPVGYVHQSAYINTPGGTVNVPGTPTSIFGLGDIEFGAGIAWHHSPTFHSIFAVDVVAPTGTIRWS